MGSATPKQKALWANSNVPATDPAKLTRLPDQVVLRLRAVTMPADGFLWNWRHIFVWEGRRPPEFAGQIREDDFALQYLSPFWGATSRPLVLGLIVGTGAGTELRIRMRAVGLGVDQVESAVLRIIPGRVRRWRHHTTGRCAGSCARIRRSVMGDRLPANSSKCSRGPSLAQ